MQPGVIRQRLRIHGRVQGVGYRWFARSAAQAASLVGWVRNLDDGTVQCEAQGPGAHLDRFAGELRRGPAFGRVDQVSIEEIPAVTRAERDFEIVH